ncbi:GNAT family N-acetyltransferase, partial [Phocaeicola vulgatus]
SIPLYSASTSNLASLGLAKKAGGIFFGNGFCVC